MVDTEILFHFVELATAIVLLCAVFFAIKKSKLVIWKRSWYIVFLGVILLTLNSAYGLYLHFSGSQIGDLFLHSLNSIILFIFAVGIFALVKSIAKVWR